jgi:RNA polymerase sigma factor (sigma-70 family)
VPANDPLLSLIDRFRGPDEPTALAAFVELRTALSPRLIEVASYLLNSAADARDLVDELFSDLWSRRTECAIQSSPRSYFERAVQHRALNMLRAESRRKRREAEWVEDTVRRAGGKRRMPGGDLAVDEDVHARLEAAEVRAAVLDAMRALPERQLQVFQRRCTGMEYSEIAQVLGMRERTARNHFTRVMQSFRQRFPWLASPSAREQPADASLDTSDRRRA